jgi:hypothetical protein
MFDAAVVCNYCAISGVQLINGVQLLCNYWVMFDAAVARFVSAFGSKHTSFPGS